MITIVYRTSQPVTGSRFRRKTQAGGDDNLVPRNFSPAWGRGGKSPWERGWDDEGDLRQPGYGKEKEKWNFL